MKKLLHIFKAGKHRSMEGEVISFTEAMIDDMAACYDPALHESPLVHGHPTTDGPAQGWAKSLIAEGGNLYAVPQQVNALFAEQVKSGAYKKISAAFYTPNHPTNPKPGHYYLRHIGFLGAMAPVVKGLEGPAFAEAEARFAEAAAADLVVEVSFAEMEVRPWVFGSIARVLRGMRDYIIERDGREKADEVISDSDINEVSEEESRLREASRKHESTSTSTSFSEQEEDMTEEERKKLEAQQKELESEKASFAEKQSQLAKEKEELAAEKRKSRVEANASFAEGLVVAGKLLPRDKPAVAEVLTMLQDAGQAQACFAEQEGGAEEQADAWLKRVLGNLPQTVTYSEVAPAGATPPAAGGDFRLPSDIDSSRLAASASDMGLHRQIKDYQAAKGVSYAEAVTAVTVNQ